MGRLATLCPTWLDAENSRLLWGPAPPHQRCPVSSGKQADGMWFWCLRGHGHPPPGRGRQPSVLGSAASKLQEADLKGDQGPGGGAHGHSGRRRAGNQQRKSGSIGLRETKEQSCLIKCPRDVARVPLLVKSSIVDAHT